MSAPMLAAIDGSWIFFLLMVAAGSIIEWLSKKRKEKAAQAPEKPAGETPGAPARPIPPAQSEQERLRKFLEALGLPQDAAPPPVQQPPPQRPAPVPKASAPPPVQRPAPIQRETSAPRRTVVVQKPKPPVFAPPQPPARPRKPAPTLEPAGESVWGADEFATVTKGVELSALDAIPLAAPAPEAPAMPSERPSRRATAVQGVDVLAMLRSPEDLRKAFIVREILGPPPGLQS